MTDPASSTRIDKKGLNDNNSRLLGIVNKFCIPFGTKSKNERADNCSSVTFDQNGQKCRFGDFE